MCALIKSVVIGGTTSWAEQVSILLRVISLAGVSVKELVIPVLSLITFSVIVTRDSFLYKRSWEAYEWKPRISFLSYLSILCSLSLSGVLLVGCSSFPSSRTIPAYHFLWISAFINEAVELHTSSMSIESIHGFQCCACIEEAEKVLEELSQKGEFAFGSFWGRLETSGIISSSSCLGLANQEFDLFRVNWNTSFFQLFMIWLLHEIEKSRHTWPT